MKETRAATRKKGHSEDFFGDYRDFWWNESFLNLLARRLDLHQCHSMLDVGCGQCHWSKLLVNYLTPTEDTPIQVCGVDSDRKWAKGSPALRAYFEEKGVDFELKKANADTLPYPDNWFDLVTCQTLLIHVPQPTEVIAEMVRVLRPGGIILCAEPNNLVQSLTRSSISSNDPVDDVLEHVKYALLFERGKKELGQGDNSLGDLVPGLLAQAGLESIDVRLSDKAIAMYPPYDTAEQVATRQQWKSGDRWNSEEFSEYDYFKALGQESLDFYEYYVRKYAHLSEKTERFINARKYHSGGGAMMYVVSAVKPFPV
ncbi:class I SAM-dependent methyltransferase [Arundinibacter roseus]|uniref:Class I SAM-dependent methyltransferase n=1 Tax=Arundinibacter roseus TaxID=2070510 RepID=A0A4R4KG59_9BACT|nr:class I SAM-dependent methyltransferase [Arundinibacter roseus]TDB65872.1 class I SAM-dependent methyltransferase [Arundinibacter roseus]